MPSIKSIRRSTDAKYRAIVSFNSFYRSSIPPEIRQLIFELAIITNYNSSSIIQVDTPNGDTVMIREAPSCVIAMRPVGRLYWEMLEVYYENTTMYLKQDSLERFKFLSNDILRLMKTLSVSADLPTFRIESRLPILDVAVNITNLHISYDTSIFEAAHTERFIEDFLSGHQLECVTIEMHDCYSHPFQAAKIDDLTGVKGVLVHPPLSYTDHGHVLCRLWEWTF